MGIVKRVICSYTENIFYWELSNEYLLNLILDTKLLDCWIQNRRHRHDMYENMQNIKPYRDHDFVFIFSPNFFWYTDLNERRNILKHNLHRVMHELIENKIS